MVMKKFHCSKHSSLFCLKIDYERGFMVTSALAFCLKKNGYEKTFHSYKRSSLFCLKINDYEKGFIVINTLAYFALRKVVMKKVSW